ncbi:hypothetical protein BDY21DRAFT_350015 [Lineolata rhizophorae]|uniref:Uncharacterized protein n=1 Tax=Lineolata rhizophorae TaxID=578093 RepID=A0A6A6NVC8_9PEZI|nr:hypothetical protein BDY21DRAFT_350015 [Lineolata rhizophorae]
MTLLGSMRRALGRGQLMILPWISALLRSRSSADSASSSGPSASSSGFLLPPYLGARLLLSFPFLRGGVTPTEVYMIFSWNSLLRWRRSSISCSSK